MKKKALVCFLLCLFQAQVFSQAQVAPWETYSVTGINKEKYHVNIIPFETLETALKCDVAGSPFYIPLNNAWQKSTGPGAADTTTAWFKKENEALLPLINAPLLWPTTLYRSRFLLPQNWDDREVFLSFERVYPAYFLWVNGKKVGYSENGGFTSEFNISRYLKKDTNYVIVQVLSTCDGQLFDKNATEMPLGLAGNTFLYSTPSLHISDYKVETGFDESYNNATLRIKGEVRNLDKRDLYKYSVEFALYDARNKPVFVEKSPLFSFAKSKNKTKGVNYEKLVVAPKKWDTESPSLYTLVITMRSDKDKILEILAAKVGFRELEMKNGLLLLNGKRLIINGINLPEIYKTQKPGLTTEEIKQTIFNLKQNNVNAIRSPYTVLPSEWYNLCSLYGLLIYSEPDLALRSREINWPVDTNGMDVFNDHFLSICSRDKNHPSVVFWGLGSADKWLYPHSSTLKKLHTLDKTRPVIFNNPAQNQWADMVAAKDTSEKHLARLATSGDKPFISMAENSEDTAYSFGENRALLMKIYPRFQGGFSSYYVADTLLLDNKNSANTYLKSVYGPIAVELADTLNGKVFISNLLHSTNLSVFSISWQLRSSEKVLQSGTVKADVPAGDTQETVLGFKKEYLKPGVAYFIDFKLKLAANVDWVGKGHIAGVKTLDFIFSQKEKH